MLAYYGLLAIADVLERPFAYTHGSFNLALEDFGLQSHNDTLDVAALWSKDDVSFVPTYLTAAAVEPGAGEGKGKKGKAAAKA